MSEDTKAYGTGGANVRVDNTDFARFPELWAWNNYKPYVPPLVRRWPEGVLIPKAGSDKHSVIVSSEEHEIGDIINWRAAQANKEHLNGSYLVVSKQRAYRSPEQWWYEVDELPKNRMTYQEMMEIST